MEKLWILKTIVNNNLRKFLIAIILYYLKASVKPCETNIYIHCIFPSDTNLAQIMYITNSIFDTKKTSISHPLTICLFDGSFLYFTLYSSYFFFGNNITLNIIITGNIIFPIMGFIDAEKKNNVAPIVIPTTRAAR